MDVMLSANADFKKFNIGSTISISNNDLISTFMAKFQIIKNYLLENNIYIKPQLGFGYAVNNKTKTDFASLKKDKLKSEKINDIDFIETQIAVGTKIDMPNSNISFNPEIHLGYLSELKTTQTKYITTIGVSTTIDGETFFVKLDNSIIQKGSSPGNINTSFTLGFKF